MATNPVDALRLRRILSQLQLVPPGNRPEDITLPPSFSVPPRPMTNLETINPTIQQPTTTDKLKTLIGGMPEQEDYRPSLLRKILGYTAAGITGAGRGAELGAQTGSNIINAPYRTAMEDWGSKYRKLKGISDIETSTAEAKRKADIEGREITVKEYGAESEAERVHKIPTVAQTMAIDEAQFKAELDKAEKTHDFKMIEEVYTQGKLSERQQAEVDAAMDRVIEQQRGAKAVATIGAVSREKVADINKKIQEEKDKKVLGTQQAASYSLSIKKVIAENPEYNNLITFEGNSVKLKTPDELAGWFGSEKDAIIKLRNFTRLIEREYQKSIKLAGGPETPDDSTEDEDFLDEPIED